MTNTRKIRLFLLWDALFFGIIGILTPVGVYIAAPALMKMYANSQAPSGIRALGIAAGMFFLAKAFVDLKARALHRKWVLVSTVLAAPIATYGSYIFLSGLFNGADFVDATMALLMLFGTSILVTIYGLRFLLNPDHKFAQNFSQDETP